MKINLIPLEQPFGKFYFGVIKGDILVQSVDILRRSESKDYVQRKENQERIKNISLYCNDPDAIFPTPIIVAVDSEKFPITNNALEFSLGQTIGEAIDGQHRILGIEMSGKGADFDIPVIFMDALEAWEKAYVFATVNSNQKQVPSSVIYDLFGLINDKYRSPQGSCHIIANTFQTDEKSPFYNRLKMLGNKTDDLQYLSQGTFVKLILEKLISKKPQQDLINLKLGNSLDDDPSRPLRKYFLKEEDHKIYKILLNYFNAISKTFNNEWNDPDKYILTKATGFSAFIKALVGILEDAFAKKDVSEDYFTVLMVNVSAYFRKFKISLTADTYPPSGKTETDLANEITDVIKAYQRATNLEQDLNDIYLKYHQ